MTTELEVELRPFWTHQQHHHHIHDEVKGQYAHDDNSWSLQRIQDGCNDNGDWEIAEPDDVHDSQNTVENQFKSSVLNEVDLPHLPHDVEEKEKTICCIEPACPGLVNVILLSREWEQCLLDLQERQYSCILAPSLQSAHGVGKLLYLVHSNEGGTHHDPDKEDGGCDDVKHPYHQCRLLPPHCCRGDLPPLPNEDEDENE